ncbi:MAG: hypothetical protein IT462_08160 [Planctomycetes bacterium]|nr:hypothetical protein [Planctomycetota bacterium]
MLRGDAPGIDQLLEEDRGGFDAREQAQVSLQIKVLHRLGREGRLRLVDVRVHLPIGKFGYSCGGLIRTA